MIIKILPIKTLEGVGRLIDYIASDKGKIDEYREQAIFHNVIASSLDKLTWEFRNNYEVFAKKRSNGNKAVHVILSVSPLDRDKITAEKMDGIVNTFLAKAYPNAMAFGTHHKQQHWHTHLIVSPNDLMKAKSTRLSKEQLRAVHLELLEHIRENHPDISIGIDEKNWGRKVHDGERAYYQQKRNPEIVMTRDVLSAKVQELFRFSESPNQFYNRLKEEGFETYNLKDQVQGIYWGKDRKKMRFTRLGIEKKEIEELSIAAKRLEEIEQIRFDETGLNDIETPENDREI